MRFGAFTMGLLLLLAGMAFGADVDGTWTGTASTPGGDFPVNFTFKAEGGTLTGTMLDQGNNQIPIKDGKIDGNNISFTVTLDFGGQEITVSHKGVMAADEIKFSGESMGMPFEFTVKKAK
jgi:hypothetical protein